MKPLDEPLSGVRILVGRARHQAAKLSGSLARLGADVLEIPFIEIRPPRSYKPLDSALARLSQYDWLILTSVNGVEALSRRLKALKIAPREISHLEVAAIGPATRAAVEDFGLTVSVVPEQYVAESVVRSLAGRVERKRVLLARAKVARDVIPRELKQMGARLDVVEAYQTVVPEASRSRLRSIMRSSERRPHVVTFTSSSTVRNFVRLAGARARPAGMVFNGVQFASIGPVTSATLRDFGLPVDIEASEYTIEGLTRAIVMHWRGQRYAR
ncbi:MAG: uroporphyrinogen-III synthase [Acidobacteria bacterium]|nr:uroporphyrinogen-III synthase [Acidobacteriota bacterium]